MSEIVGIRELRQQASELVRRASRGEEIVLAVGGYPTARLVPLEDRRWRRVDQLAEFLSAPIDPTWERVPGEALIDPWDR
jgi:prevent-host-death family protein